MAKTGFWVVVIVIMIAGCSAMSPDARDQIVKIVDFELSPDEDKLAFSALTPIGNTDVWVVDIDGANLKKLTFKDRSPSNHVARFFKKRKWRNFYKVDIHSPEWTKDARISFCQELMKYDAWGSYTVNKVYWTINPDGTSKKRKTEKDETARKRRASPINIYKRSEYSEKYKKTILRKDRTLWILNDGEASPKKLI